MSGRPDDAGAAERVARYKRDRAALRTAHDWECKRGGFVGDVGEEHECRRCGSRLRIGGGAIRYNGLVYPKVFAYGVTPPVGTPPCPVLGESDA